MRITSANFEPESSSETTSLQEVLVALSFALDLTEGAVQGHAIRSCLMAMRIALAVGLDQDLLSDLYYASLLKDVGCSSNSARMCQIVGGDDRLIKAGVKLEDWSKPQSFRLSTIKLLWEQVLPGAGFFEKTAWLLKISRNEEQYGRELIELRCDRGAQIVRKLGLGDTIAIAVRHLDEHWDGKGYPMGLKGHEIPILSRIICIAQHLDVFCMQRGPEAAMETLKERSGRWFDPELVAAAIGLDKARRLFRECLPEDSIELARTTVLSLHPVAEENLDSALLDNICEAFADVVDAKSPFTFRHSMGVRDAAVAIGRTLGLAPERIQTIRRAALLHDVGKLGISNTILDKPSMLTSEEFSLVKAHPGMSREILSRIRTFREIALLAGEHHEKLDGTGYPYGLVAEELSLESRILSVADFYAALSEHRPYRAGMTTQEIMNIMGPSIPVKLDRECYSALLIVMNDLSPHETPVPEQTIPGAEKPAFGVAEAFI